MGLEALDLSYLQMFLAVKRGAEEVEEAGELQATAPTEVGRDPAH